MSSETILILNAAAYLAIFLYFLKRIDIRLVLKTSCFCGLLYLRFHPTCFTFNLGLSIRFTIPR